MLLVQLSLTVNMGFLIVHLVSCTETENTNSTVEICWMVESNKSHKMEERCNHCSLCPLGTYVVENCTKTKDTRCRECPVGTYSTSENSQSCLRCTECADYGKSNIMECSRTEDTKCGCPNDTFLKNGRCVPCSKCPPGKQVSKTCGNHSDTECVTCRRGSYSNQENSKTYCQACHVCYKNRIELQSCSPTTNTICGGCKEGHYQEKNTANCAKCSYCYPEIPGYTFQVDECLGLMHDPNYTCIPVSAPPSGVFGNEIDATSVSPLAMTSLSATEQVTCTPRCSNDVVIRKFVLSTFSIIGVVIFIIVIILLVIKFGKGFMTKSIPGAKPLAGILLRCLCTNYKHLDRQRSEETGVELNQSNGQNKMPARQQSVESEEETNRHDTPVIEEGDIQAKSDLTLTQSNKPTARRQSVVSEEETNRHDTPPVIEVHVCDISLQTLSDLTLPESNKPTVRQQSVESGKESYETDGHGMKPVSAVHKSMPSEGPSDEFDSGYFESIQSVNELERSNESDDGTQTVCSDSVKKPLPYLEESVKGCFQNDAVLN